MFNKEKIKELERRVNHLEYINAGLERLVLDAQKERKEELDLIKTNISNFESKIQGELVGFHTEISDKYINAIEKIIQTTKETMLIDTLIKQISERDLVNLKRTLMQPILEERIKETDKVKADTAEETVKTKGEKIMAMKKDLEERFLKLDRKELDTTQIKAQLDLLNSLLEVNGGETSQA